MSGGSLVDYRYYVIDDCANEIEERIEDQKKPEPPTYKVHYVSIMKQVGDGIKIGVHNHNCHTLEGAKRYLLQAYNATEKFGHIYDIYDVWTDKDGIEHPCEYFISEGEYDEYEDGHDDCYYGERYSKETIDEFKKAVNILNKASIYAHRIDWLLSGDDSEETFHKRLKEELDKLNEIV